MRAIAQHSGEDQEMRSSTGAYTTFRIPVEKHDETAAGHSDDGGRQSTDCVQQVG